MLNKKLNSDNIVYSHVSAVKLKTAGELPWSLDGEYGGDMPQAEIHILKQAIQPGTCYYHGQLVVRFPVAVRKTSQSMPLSFGQL